MALKGIRLLAAFLVLSCLGTPGSASDLQQSYPKAILVSILDWVDDDLWGQLLNTSLTNASMTTAKMMGNSGYGRYSCKFEVLYLRVFLSPFRI